MGDMADYALEQVIDEWGTESPDYSVDEWHSDHNTCPLCDAPLVLRTNRHTGQRFRGCSKFPKCKGSLPRAEEPKP